MKAHDNKKTRQDSKTSHTKDFDLESHATHKDTGKLHSTSNKSSTPAPPQKSPKSPAHRAHKSSLESHILQVASRLFALLGYAATSTRAIAAESGANLAMIRYYYGSKEGLYQAVLEAQRDAIYHAIETGRTQWSKGGEMGGGKIQSGNIQEGEQRLKNDKAENSRSYAQEALRAYAAALVAHAREHGDFAALLANEASNTSEVGAAVLGECFARMFEFVSECFARGMDWGEFRADVSPLQLSFHFGAIINFYIHSLRLKTSSLPIAQIPDNYVESALDTLFRAI